MLRRGGASGSGGHGRSARLAKLGVRAGSQRQTCARAPTCADAPHEHRRGAAGRRPRRAADDSDRNDVPPSRRPARRARTPRGRTRSCTSEEPCPRAPRSAAGAPAVGRLRPPARPRRDPAATTPPAPPRQLSPGRSATRGRRAAARRTRRTAARASASRAGVARAQARRRARHRAAARYRARVDLAATSAACGADAKRRKRTARHLRRPAAPPTSAIPPQLQAIAACESGGNPRAVDAQRHVPRPVPVRLPAPGRPSAARGDPAAAPEVEQYRRAAMLYARAGAAPWPVCGR